MGTEFVTLPETNIAPEKRWLEYYFPFGIPYFQGQKVSFREGKRKKQTEQICSWVFFIQVKGLYDD